MAELLRAMVLVIMMFSGRDDTTPQTTSTTLICHSIKEDSDIIDCDYNGADNGWHPVRDNTHS